MMKLRGALAALVLAAAPQEEPRLTRETFAALRDRILPPAEDRAWENLPWNVGLFDGLVAAHRAAKPMLVIMYCGLMSCDS